MTDSVNCVAFFDPVSLLISAGPTSPRCLCGLAGPPGGGFLLRGRLLRRRRSLGRRRRGGVRNRDLRLVVIVGGDRLRAAVEPAVVLGRPEDPLHVVLRLGERNVVDPL